MREPFQDTLRVRMPASLTERLRLTARRIAGSPATWCVKRSSFSLIGSAAPTDGVPGPDTNPPRAA